MLTILGVMLGGCAGDAPPIVEPGPGEVAAVRADIAALCAPAMEGRGVGTAGISRARDWVAQRFEKLGLRPGVHGDALGEASYLQAVPVFTDDGEVTLHNVVGVIPGHGTLADEYVVVGAHYDHLGFGHTRSRDPAGAGQLHPGADDNASGVAAMLRVAEHLASRSFREPDRRAVAFVAFTAEEIGLLGSHYFALHPEHLGDGARVVAMINLDMVGNLTDGRLRVWGVGTGDGLRAIAAQANANVNLRLRLEDEPGARSDHVSFHGRGVPAVLLITHVHDRYHTPADTPDRVNHGGVAVVARYAGAMVEVLATLPEAPAFVARTE